MSRLCPRCGALHEADDARYCSCTSLTAARAAMHRRQEIITRGEILDAIDAALRVMNADHTTLHALREAFE